MIYDELIIGCGLTGAILANHLENNHHQYLVLDKGRGVGGRLSSKRFDETFFNHGTQEIGTNLFENEKWFQQWIKNNWIKKKSDGWEILSKSSDLIKSIIQINNVKLNTKVISINQNENYLQILTENGESYSTKRLFVTTPLPQALDLCKNILDKKTILDFSKIRYQEVIIFFLQNIEKTQASYNNNFKIESKNNKHMLTWSNEISSQYFALDSIKIIQQLLPQLTYYFSKITDSHIEVKKWRYALPCNYIENSFFISKDNQLIICGDAFRKNSELNKPTSSSTESAFEVIKHLSRI